MAVANHTLGQHTARPPAGLTAEPTGPVAGGGRFLVVRECGTEDVLLFECDSLDQAFSLAGAALDVLETEGETGAIVVLDRDGGEWRPVL